MRTIKFSKEYIKAELLGCQNAGKTHGIIDQKPYTMCGFGIETDTEREGKVTCPDCIEQIEKCKKLVKGRDY